MVIYRDDQIQKTALSLVTSMTSFLALAGLPVSEDEEEAERGRRDRRKVKDEVMTLSHSLLAQIRTYYGLVIPEEARK